MSCIFFGKYETIEKIENYFNKKIKIFVVIETHNSHIKIIHEITTSYYPEMNGKTEKKKIDSLLN